MFEKWFAKYARAVGDERERAWLYQKYRTKTIVSILFYALCVAVFAAALILNSYLEQGWALAVMVAVIFAWLGFAVADLCLWISFKRTFRAILRRPAGAGEMPEVAAYRQKVSADKRSTFRKLWWAWLLFGLCAVAFIACIVLETIQNPASEEFGAWGTAAFWVLLAGALVLAFAYIINSVLKQQQGKTIEQQTESEAQAIDKAQGRKHEYNIQADKNLQTYEYLFPNKHLYAEAEEIRKKYSKILMIGVIVCSFAALIAAILLVCSADFFGKNIAGYVVPVVLTAIFCSAAIFSLPMTVKLNDVERKQKEELETYPEYAKNLAWYRLNDRFYKFKGKILYAFIAVSLVLGWVLAILFPATAWSLLSFVPMATGTVISNRLVKGQRQKAIPLEKEIDADRLAPHDVRFCVTEGEADENVRIYYDGDSLMSDGESGGITLYLGETLFCMDIDEADCRAAEFSSGQMYIDELPYAEVPAPQNVRGGKLTALLNHKLANGTCWRICFEGGGAYDPARKNVLVGDFRDDLPVYRIFKNGYVQLSEEGNLLGVLCTQIDGQESEAFRAAEG